MKKIAAGVDGIQGTILRVLSYKISFSFSHEDPAKHKNSKSVPIYKNRGSQP